VEQAAPATLSLYFQAQVSSRTELAESYAKQNGAGYPLVSMTIQGPRQSAANPNLAYTALAGAIQAQFKTEFEQQISTHSN
jgi:hypothetical protein